WRPEDVPDELRVDRPVHPELELLDEPRRDADREVDQHERPKEARQAEPVGVLRPVPDRLHDRDERREAERERNEQEVVEARGRELHAREIDGADSERHAPILRGAVSAVADNTDVANVASSRVRNTPPTSPAATQRSTLCEDVHGASDDEP